MTKEEKRLDKKLTAAIEKVNVVQKEINNFIENSGAGFNKTPLSQEFKTKYGDNQPSTEIVGITADSWSRSPRY